MNLAERFRSSALPAVVVPQAVSPALAADVRERLRGAWVRHTAIDRARMEVVPALDPSTFAEVLDGLASATSAVTGRELRVVSARALRLGPGDFALVRHDRVQDDRPIEVTLDLSEAEVPGAEVHYRHRGQLFFTFAGPPRALAVVERGPTVLCNHTYVSKRHAVAVVRLVALLREG